MRLRKIWPVVLLLVLAACSGVQVPPIGDTTQNPPLRLPENMIPIPAHPDYAIPAHDEEYPEDALQAEDDPYPPELEGTPPDEAPLPDDLPRPRREREEPLDGPPI
jgi:hypothetical protein